MGIQLEKSILTLGDSTKVSSKILFFLGQIVKATVLFKHSQGHFFQCGAFILLQNND